VGRRIWIALERACPEVEVWETFIPWFEKRNICFDVSVSGGSGEDAMFRFVKRLRQDRASCS
jgi:hypothetical protein